MRREGDPGRGLGPAGRGAGASLLVAARATFWRWFVTALRAYPYSFLIGNIIGAAYMVGLAYLMYWVLFGGQVSDRFLALSGCADYLSYVLTGALTYQFAARTMLNVSRMLITEYREGTIEVLLVTPVSRAGYHAGQLLAQTLTTSMECAVVVAIAVPLGFHVGRVNGPALAASLALSLLALYGMSTVLGAFMLYYRETFLSQNTLFAAIMIVSGITFPPEYLPAWAQAVGWCLPVTWSLRALRGSLLAGAGLGELAPCLGLLLGLSVVYIAVGRWALGRAEKVALEKAAA